MPLTTVKDPRIQKANAWAWGKLGLPYDHGPTPCRFFNCPPPRLMADCSGATTMYGVQLGQPKGSIPESSGDIAAFFRGRGRRYALPVAEAKRTPSAMLIYGGTNNGDRGHIVINPTADGLTWESSGRRGVSRQDINRLPWSDAGLFPVMVDHPAPPPKPIEEDEVEHGMAVDMVVNPEDHASGYTLDRWGGIHPFGKAPVANSPSFWPGKDVARRLEITNWSRPAGFVMDLNGGIHPFGGAPTPAPGAPYWKGGVIKPFNEI